MIDYGIPLARERLYEVRKLESISKEVEVRKLEMIREEKFNAIFIFPQCEVAYPLGLP